MFSHNLAPQIKSKVYISKLHLVIVLAFALALFFLLQSIWHAIQVEPMAELNKSNVLTKSIGAKGIAQQVKAEQCEQYQTQYQLLGVVLNGEQNITLVKHHLAKHSRVISNLVKAIDELNLISAELTFAIFQLGSCQFRLNLINSQQKNSKQP